ncbi:gamma-aminobutyric acid type B receptor subunit 2-like [Clytia hemisphaerica]|uniref:G-protein coupled receptors family 3 profile domain-containing protein n=2 Tax=Clytia hemisphaerica TaxID=252671 RepID=A0A7M5X7I2_9CNID|eukprot:TCONS_00005769-protein
MSNIHVACYIILLVTLTFSPPCCYGNNPAVAVDNRTILNIAFFTPESFRDIYCLHSAVELAVSYVNNNDSILPNHKIVISRYPLQVDVTRNLAGNLAHRFFQMMGDNKGTIQGMIGPAQSKTFLALQQFNTKYLIPNIGYAALTDQETSFSKDYDVRVNPKINSFLDATLHLFKRAGWKKCGILYTQGDDSNSRTNSKLVETLLIRLKKIHAKAIVVEKFKESEAFQESTFPKLKKNDVRVIVLISRVAGLRRTFCEAYKRNYYGKKIVYIVLGLIDSRWHSNSECPRSELFKASNGAITFHKVNVRPDGTPTVFGKTGVEVKQGIKEMREKLYGMATRYSCKDNLDTYGFDAITNMMLGYHHIIQNLYNGSRKFVIERYGDELMMKQAVHSFRYNHFEGITGRVSYTDDNERKGNYFQLATIAPRNEFSTKFDIKAYFNGDTLSFKDPNDGLASIFIGEKIPIDGLREKKVAISLNVSLKYTIWTLTCLLILFSVMFLFINVIHRNRSLIKMSSPNINNIILLGSILCYTTVIMNGIDSSTVLYYQIGHYCNTVIVVFAAGFTLLFGGLFIKTWRVYRIFTAVETLKTVAIKDPQLYLMVFLMLLIDGIICTAWLLVSPYQMTSLEVSRRVISNSTEYVEVYNSCVAIHDTKFEVAMFLYKGLVMLFGLFMAWETRNVNIAALNDSKQIGMSIYGVVVMGILGTICMYALEGHKFVNVRYAIVTLAIVVSTFSTVLFVFLPKVVLLYGTEDRLREKERIRTHSKESSIHNSSNLHTNSYQSNLSSSSSDRHDNNSSVVDAMEENSSPGQPEMTGNLNVIYEHD